ncbi:hypothetical protein OBBRIDRAFT_808208 [Obba rivulosa]|uniref:Uncharacterized protein n=1 Tax=Obba rivulosa TaxID=1052685 RepID=A0A8E2APR1_9APHY|nr:hypothetical protein OBBRIDRAFT_808208 [Obba rivulosa]
MEPYGRLTAIRFAQLLKEEVLDLEQVWISYAPRPPLEALSEAELHGSEPYDINWAFPLDLSVLSMDEIFLTPLQLPIASPPSLGLHRVQWGAQADNATSIGLARRLGMTLNACFRWHRALPAEWPGKMPQQGDPWEDKDGKDTVFLAICWDHLLGEEREGEHAGTDSLIAKPLEV